jgi:hypothetical protein
VDAPLLAGQWSQTTLIVTLIPDVASTKLQLREQGIELDISPRTLLSYTTFAAL